MWRLVVYPAINAFHSRRNIEYQGRTISLQVAGPMTSKYEAPSRTMQSSVLRTAGGRGLSIAVGRALR